MSASSGGSWVIEDEGLLGEGGSKDEAGASNLCFYMGASNS